MSKARGFQPRISGNNIQHPSAGWIAYSGINTADPDLDLVRNTGFVYHAQPKAGSPAIASGDPVYATSTDILGRSRNSSIDLGSVQSESLAVVNILLQDEKKPSLLIWS